MADEKEKGNDPKALAKVGPVPAGTPTAVVKEGGAAPAPTQVKTALQKEIAAAEAQLASISEKAQVIMSLPLSASVKRLKEHFEKDANIEVGESAFAGLVGVLRQKQPCIFIGSVNENNDVVKLISILKSLREEVRSNRLKFIVLSKINNPAIVKTFEGYGCHEYIVEPIADRSLQFKMNLQTKANNAQRKNLKAQEQRRIDSMKGVGKGSDQVVLKGGNGQNLELKSLGNDKGDGNVKVKEGKQGKSDVWVFSGNKPKKAGGKWTMRMKGPEPSEGDWVETKKEDGGSAWRFMEKGEKEAGPNGKKKEGWEWQGEKPQFQNGEWSFQGEKPDLSFVDENGQKQASKVSLDGAAGLVMEQDSKEALKAAEDREEKRKLKLEEKKQGLFKSDDKEKKQLDFRDFAIGEDKPKDYDDKVKPDEAKADWRKSGSDSEKSAKELKEKPKKPTVAELDDIFGDSQAKPHQESKKETSDAKTGSAGPNPKPKRNPLLMSESEEPKEETSKLDFRDFAFEDEEKKKKLELKEGEEIAKKPDTKIALPEAKKEKPKRENPFAPKKKDAAAPKAEEKKKEEGAAPKDIAEAKKDRKAEKRVEQEKAEEDKKQKKLNSLAEMAMVFGDDKKDYEDKTSEDEDAPVGGKNEAKTEKFKNSDWNGHDLSPEAKKEKGATEGKESPLKPGEAKKRNPFAVDPEKVKSAEVAARQAREKKERQNPFAPKKKTDATKDGKTEEEQKPDSLDSSSKNFLGNTDNTGLASMAMDEEKDKSFNQITKEDPKGTDWNARDSKNEEEEVDDEDKLIETEAPSGKLNVKFGTDGEVFEFPLTHFGDPNGAWESAGLSPGATSKDKTFVYVVAAIRMRKVDDVRTLKDWWVFTGEKPAILNKKKAWAFKKAKPEKVELFANLPLFVQEYLLSISPNNVKKKREEEVQEKKKQKAVAEEKTATETKAKEEELSDIFGDSSSPKKKKAEEPAAEEERTPKATEKKKKEKPEIAAVRPPKVSEAAVEAPASKAETSAVFEAGAAKPAQKKIVSGGGNLSLPTSPMVAIFLSELLVNPQHTVPEALAKFCELISGAASKLPVTILAAGGAAGAFSVAASSDASIELGAEANDERFPGLSEGMQWQGTALAEAKEGVIYSPVKNKADGKILGVLVVGAKDSGAKLDEHCKYFYGVAQMLRGALMGSKLLAIAPKKEAA